MDSILLSQQLPCHTQIKFKKSMYLDSLLGAGSTGLARGILLMKHLRRQDVHFSLAFSEVKTCVGIKDDATETFCETIAAATDTHAACIV